MKPYIQSCHECQLYSPAPHERSPLRGTSQNIMGIFKQFSIDYVGRLPITDTGCKYILVCTEMFTRWPMAVATKHANAITAATFLYEEVFTKFGHMTTILSDNGSHFANQVVKKYVKICQSKHKFGTPYHPETQGMVEKLNHTLVNALRKLAHQRPNTWDTHLHTVLYSYRVRAHESIEIPPYELLYGVVPVDAQHDPLLAFGKSLGFDRLMALPDIRSDIVMNEAKYRAKQPASDVIRFLPGTLVLFKNFNKTDKLSSNWHDQVYVVVAAFQNNTYSISNVKTGRLFKRRTNGTHCHEPAVNIEA